MDLMIEEREAFYIAGYVVETSLETCVDDISKVWKQFQREKGNLFSTIREGEGYYGLMWYTTDHRYCYLLGVASHQPVAEENELCCRAIPAGRFARVEVPEDDSVLEAWREFFDVTLPENHLAPDYEHGMFFEYYPEEYSAACQLWSPIKAVEAK
jgi:AraC family transcriptional regulator